MICQCLPKKEKKWGSGEAGGEKKIIPVPKSFLLPGII